MKRIVLLLAGLASVAAGFSLAADPASQDIALEHTAAPTTANYTVIPHVLFNSGAAGGTDSFIRFANTSGGTANFDVKVIGGETGFDYSSFKPFRITVADKASPQRSVDEIRRAIIADGGPDIAPKSGDTFLNFYITSDKTSGVSFQHVTYNSVTGFFENASACTYIASEDYTTANQQLINVHTSQLAAYPSKIEIHNPDFATRAIRVTVYDAATGTSLGAFAVNLAANSSKVLDFAAIEQQINFKPTQAQLHVNIGFETADSLPYSAVVLHKVTQASSGAVFNLTSLCKINTVRTTACTATTDTSTNPSGAGGTSGNSCMSAVPDTLSLAFTVGQPATIPLSALTANDSGVADATLDAVTEFVGSDGAKNGDFTNTATSITYTPARGGYTYFAYRLKNPTGQTATAAVTLNVGGQQPSAMNDTLTQEFKVKAESTIRLSTLIANDLNAAGATLEDVKGFADATGANGTFSVLAATAVSAPYIAYVPARSGTVTFTYRIRTAVGLSNAATVTLTVADNTLPNAVGDTLTQEFKPGVAAVIDIETLIANDANATGAKLEEVTGFTEYFGGASSSSPVNGTYSAAADKISYTPARTGAVAFFYRIRTPAGLSNQTIVLLTVSNGSGAPVAVADTWPQEISPGIHTLIPLQSLLANDINTTGAKIQDITALSDATGPNGASSITSEWIDYTPARGGTVTFSYRFKTPAGLSNAATVTVTVKQPDGLPIAAPDVLTQEFRAGVASVIDIQSLIANDINTINARLTSVEGFTDANGVVNGAATLSPDKITYTPARAGTVTFYYHYMNGAGISPGGKVTLTVTAADPTRTPVAAEDALLNVSKTSAGDYLIPLADVMGNDVFAEGAVLDSVGGGVFDAGGRQIGNASIRDAATIRLTMLSSSPNPWVGKFTYQIKNSLGSSNPGQVTVYFTGLGTAVPVALPDTLMGPFPPGSHRNVLYTEMLANDTSSGATTFAITAAGFRTKSTNAPNGTFSYTLTNSAGTSQPAAVTLTVK